MGGGLGGSVGLKTSALSIGFNLLFFPLGVVATRSGVVPLFVFAQSWRMQQAADCDSVLQRLANHEREEKKRLVWDFESLERPAKQKV